MKKYFLLLFLIIFQNLLSNELNVLIDENRFFDDSGNTILEINYQCSYKDLLFIQGEKGFSAKLGVEFLIISDQEVIYTDKFTNRIILTEQTAINSERTFSDIISLTLSKSGFDFKVIFSDINSNDAKEWNYNFKTLDQNNLLSDMEFLYSIEVADSIKENKFQKGDKLHYANPSHIYTLGKDSLLIYYEVNLSDEMGLDLLKELIIKKDDKQIIKQSCYLEVDLSKTMLYEKIDINNFEEGYYQIEINLIDEGSKEKFSKLDFFSIKKQKTKGVQIFTNVEKEFLLISYFLQPHKRKVWKTLTESGKQNFIKRFWDTQNIKNRNFQQLVRNRVQFCNKSYSSFKEGWKTDRGRIHIKYGSPDEIVKKNTGLYTKYIQKEYQIWKYRTNQYLTFIFIDSQTSGNYGLIYSDNDDSETTLSNWESYLGKDFDSSWLQ